MKKLIYAGIVLSALVLITGGCRKDSFDYSLYKPTADDIDSVYLSTGAKFLMADGKASLQFIVETYRKITTTSGADSLVLTDYQQLPEGALKILDGNGKETGWSYTTTDAAQGSVQFYAQVGKVKSTVKTVTLRPAQVLPPKLTVNVIFHVFEQSSNDKFYDPFTYQPVTKKQLDSAISDLNNVFNNRLGHDANGASANIEFKLATTNAAGQTLTVPGLDAYVYTNVIMVNPAATIYSVSDFTVFINKTPTQIWDPAKYLNIYVLPVGANNGLGALRAMYQIVPSGQQPLPGMFTPPATVTVGTTVVALPTATAYPGGVVPADLPIPVLYETAGVGVARTLLFPSQGKRTTICAAVGSFYGLLATTGTTPGQDFCTDTRIYNSQDLRNNFTSSLKVSIDNEKFLADNAMDSPVYPSQLNTITLDQVNRIRWVIAHSPLRNNGKP